MGFLSDQASLMPFPHTNIPAVHCPGLVQAWRCFTLSHLTEKTHAQATAAHRRHCVSIGQNRAGSPLREVRMAGGVRAVGLVTLAICAAGFIAARPIWAQSYPDRPIRL